MAKITRNPTTGNIDVSQVRKYWQPTFVIDYITGEINGAVYDDGFITQHTSLKGMSGGPVFDVRGRIYGMDVATFGRRIAGSPQTIVANGVVMGVGQIREAFAYVE